MTASFIRLGSMDAGMAANLQTGSHADRHTVPVEFGEAADGERGREIKILIRNA